MVADPARGQLNRENEFSLSPFTSEGLVSETCSVVPSRVDDIIYRFISYNISTVIAVHVCWVMPNVSPFSSLVPT